MLKGTSNLITLVIVAGIFVSWTGGDIANLTGLWRMEKIEYLDSQSKEWKESEWMKGGNALLHYDDNGIMSVHFTPSEYDKTEMPNPYYLDSLTQDHLRMLSSDYWYVAKYEVEKEKKAIRHYRMMHSDPNEWGKEVVRYFEIHGDTLILSPEEFNLRVIWVKE